MAMLSFTPQARWQLHPPMVARGLSLPVSGVGDGVGVGAYEHAVQKLRTHQLIMELLGPLFVRKILRMHA